MIKIIKPIILDFDETGKWIVNQKVLDKIEELSAAQFKQYEICNFFGIGHSAWYEHKKNNPAIKRAMDLGKLGSKAYVVSKFNELLEDMDPKIRMKATTYFLDRKGGWKEDQSDIEDNISNDMELEEDLDPIEASKIYQDMMG